MMYENFRHTHGSGSGAGPIEGSARNNGASVPASKILRNGNGSSMVESTAPSKSERLNSPNTSNWEPDVRMLLSTSQWLKIHGLKRHKLDMGQILPSIGFRHSDDYVRPLKKPVHARYCKGLFTQVPFRDGTVYNLVASKEKLCMIESQLAQAILLYKRRLEWLTTESRRVFGVVEERCICIVLDVNTESESEFSTYLHALVQVLKEQVMFIAKFNLIRCAMDADCWQEHAVNVTLDSMEGALNWIWDLKTTVPHSSTATVEGILKALADQHIEAVYLFTEGSTSDGSQEMLKRKIQGSHVPIHIVSLNCNNPATITYLKDISRMSKGRFHAYSVATEYEDSFDSFTKSMEVDSTSPPRGRGRGDGMPSLRLGVGVKEDVITLWEELDEARNTLAEIQALLCEIKDPKETPISTSPSAVHDQGQHRVSGSASTKGNSEMYMSSRDWLRRHGLKAKKLVFYDLLQTLAFKHCDGVVDIQMAPGSDSSDAIVRPKLVNARYCDKFAHVRWKDGTIMHVHVSGPIHRNYEQRTLSALDSYKKRMEWLQQGSRELFGTIIEDQVAVLIDTSASMASRLFLVKDKLYRLMQEQLRHKLKFNLMKFDTRVQAWRDRLVDCNTHNLDNAWQWIKGLNTGGSTNTLASLKLALADPLCHAIYLLTDGRPDQPPSSILAQVQLLNPVPIHTISFNCADTEANQFLCQLAAETGGRFHYFSEDGYDVDGPRPFESEDLRLLREEIEKGLADLRKVTLIRNECAQLDWFGSNTGRCSKSHPRSVSASSHRPFSAKHAMTPSPPSSGKSNSAILRPASARPHASSARPRPASARLTYSSHKDYIVSSACRDIPQSPTQAPYKVAETKTSQLRLGLKKKKTSDWILKETREYIAKKPEDFKQRKTKRKTKKRNGSNSQGDQNDEDLTVKRWLKKHCLVARKLTILDALAPTVIPHSTKYVPILDKHVLSKVFDQVLPLAHTSGSNRDEVQLVNPQAVNLKAYEARLETAISDYTRRLDELVFVCLSDEERMKYPEDRVPSFLDNKASIMDDLEKQDWPVHADDINLLEKEILQAQMFLLQSKDLRQKSEEASREIAEQQRKAREEAENKRIEQIMTKSPKPSPPAQSTSNKNRLLHHKVLARNEVDGFYYAGVVSRCLNSRYVEVDFRDFDRQVVSARYVIAVQGARPCPSLKVGDYVLVRTLVPREQEDDEISDGVQCYVPGIVQVVPLRKATATKCYTILRFNGKKITSVRNDLEKISKARYTFACRYIRDALLSAYRSTTPFGMYSREAKDDAVSEDKAEKSKGDESPRSQASSRASSRASSQGHRSRSRSRSRSASPNGSATPSSKGVSPGEPAEEGRPFEELKQELEEEHRKQLDEVNGKIDELQRQLEEERERHERAAEQLKEKRRELDDDQQKFLQQQIDEQNNRQTEIQEEQKRLQNQQEDLLKKQKEQQEQLLMQQYNQTQQLQLQQQQLLQQLVNNLQATQQEKAERPRVKLPDLPPVSPPRSRSISPPSPSSDHSSPRSSPKGSVKESEKSSSKGSSRSSKKTSEKSSTPGNPVAQSSRPTSGRSRSSKRSARNSLPPESDGEHKDEESDNEDEDKQSKKSEKGKSSSSSSSSSSSPSSSDSSDNEKDEVSPAAAAAPAAPAGSEEDPPTLQIHVSNGNEACLLTKGSHGLLISRLPPDQDPAVESGRVPRPMEVGEEVLARWSDEGWYYRGTIRQDCEDGSYFVEDSVGDLEQINRPDIITEADDADNEIGVYDPVVALHPSFPYSYAPGTVLRLEDNGLHVRHYDGIESVVPREESYLITPEKFEKDCQYILQCEESLVGQAVVARNEKDGMFHLGTVRERVGNGRQYIIEWADQTVQIQSSGYIFGPHTKRRPLTIGDRVLALCDPALFVYLPGWVAGANGRRLVIKFCNGKSSSHVDPLQCFWLSRDYYDRMVENYQKMNKGR